VNQILDLLPVELWSNPDAKFLDPVCKSGVFIREMAKRLIVGLEPVFPDLQERANHIYRYQLFGLAITELTGLLSRRSVYCSKVANGRYSVCSDFEDEQGNIVYGRVEHDWRGGKCGFCGASQEVYERGDALESYAYQFIHADDPSCFFNNMKFDVIVGNPPYQLSDGGAQASAKPLYHKFIEQAKKLNPRYLSMIVPSRWFSGGKGLDDFREEMLSDKRLTKVVDYFDSNECFPGVDISGGVCYFLWERDREKTCEITTIRSGEKSTMERPLLEIDNDSFIRFNEAISIYRKIKSLKEERFNKHISSRKPFGITTNAKGNKQNGEDTIKIFSFPENGFIKRNLVKQNESWINEYKVYISYAYGERGAFPYLVIGKPFLGEPNTCCTETYLVIRPFDSLQKCENVISYMRTRFFSFSCFTEEKYSTRYKQSLFSCSNSRL